MASRVGVYLVTFGAVEVRCFTQWPCAEGDGLFVCLPGFLHVEIKVYLLRLPVRPVGRNVLRSVLNAYPPLPIGIDDTVEGLVLEHVPAEHPCPEGTFGVQICGVEDNHTTHDPHAVDSRRFPVPASDA